jgi:hypothetical protein
VQRRRVAPNPRLLHSQSESLRGDAPRESAVSGAIILLDRDTSSLVVFSIDAASMEKAAEMLTWKIAESRHLSFKLQLDPSEDWIVRTVVGRKDGRIKKLQSSTKSKIELVSASMTFIVTSETAKLASEAHSALEAMVEKLRRESVRRGIFRRSLVRAGPALQRSRARTGSTSSRAPPRSRSGSWVASPPCRRPGVG